MKIAAGIVLAVALAGCGGAKGMTVREAEAQLRAMLTSNPDEPVSVQSIRCVKLEARSFACVTDAYENEQRVTLSVRLDCDADRCVSRPE